MTELPNGTRACPACILGRVQVVEEGEEIVYTYDVYWQEGSTKWERRWGLYMQPPRSSHWVSLCNAVIMLMACCMSLGIIFSRVTDRDLIPASASPLPEKVRPPPAPCTPSPVAPCGAVLLEPPAICLLPQPCGTTATVLMSNRVCSSRLC